MFGEVVKLCLVLGIHLSYSNVVYTYQLQIYFLIDFVFRGLYEVGID